MLINTPQIKPIFSAQTEQIRRPLGVSFKSSLKNLSPQYSQYSNVSIVIPSSYAQFFPIPKRHFRNLNASPLGKHLIRAPLKSSLLQENLSPSLGKQPNRYKFPVLPTTTPIGYHSSSLSKNSKTPETSRQKRPKINTIFKKIIILFSS